MDNYEEFTQEQVKILSKYVTNTSSQIFALRNLPEVIKGALFSRYSRSSLGLRSLLLKEFILCNEESSFESIVGHLDKESQEFNSEQMNAIKKAQSFYDRILDGYGDDSIAELGGAHLAIENISMLAAKVIEDNRIGGSPLEKSTRYIYFDQKIKGQYLFYREPVLMTSAYRDLYIDTCNHLFETYSKLIGPLTALMEQKCPKEESVSKTAYAAAIRAKVLDLIRGLLPAGTLTNMGLFGNGRFFEQMLHKLNCHNLAELQEIGKKGYEELSKIIPSFIRRSHPSHKTHQNYVQFQENLNEEIRLISDELSLDEPSQAGNYVKLISTDPDCIIKIAAALLYPSSNKTLQDLIDHCRKLPEEELIRIINAGCNARENRRHKSPRAFENASFTFEISADFGCYRDLQRHRILTQERQLLTCDYGYTVPEELRGTHFETEFVEALERAKTAYQQIASELPEEAQYVVPMAYNIHWYFTINLRALQWLCELRSSAAGHQAYRTVAQEMAKQVIQAFPIFERVFKFVDFEQYAIGRLSQEEAKEKKQQASAII